MKLGLATLRLIVGTLFMGHGLQKLAGWFGGNGLEATGTAFTSLGLHPGKANAAAAGVAETAGGAMIAAGAFTPVGATLLSGTMITAIRKVHLANGPWASSGGYEYNLVLIAAVLAISDLGPGALSVDAARGRIRSGAPLAIAQLAAGAIGSLATTALAERLAPAPQEAEQTPPERNGHTPVAEEQPADA